MTDGQEEMKSYCSVDNDLQWVQVDTTNILFICGGAFIDLDRQVAERTAQSSMGFGNPVR